MTTTCTHCGTAIPTERIRRKARYCSVRCYQAAYQRRSYQSHPRESRGRFTKKGYIYWLFSKGPAIAEHRVLMEQHIGRELSSIETIHHRNGIKNDNRIENMEILSASDHSRLHYRGNPRLLKRKRLEAMVEHPC